MSDDKFDIPFQSPVTPNMMGLDSKIQFRCHKDIACFNACCKNIDIALTPYDLYRMKVRLNISSSELLNQYTVPYELDAHRTPGIKLKPVEGGNACQFMNNEGCGIYEDRPTACRYYPLGLLSLKKTDAKTDEENYALVEEDHCLGHKEDKTQTIAEYRKEQGLEEYDPLTREWRRLILKKKSAGPGIGKPSEMSLQLFFMASYNLDQFQKFVTSDQFQENYQIDTELLEKLKTDQLEVMKFSAEFMRHVLFGEETVKPKDGAWDKRNERMKIRAVELKEAAELQAEHAAKKAQENKK